MSALQAVLTDSRLKAASGIKQEMLQDLSPSAAVAVVIRQLTETSASLLLA